METRRMTVTIQEKTSEEDMDFFFKLGFWALKTLRKDMYDEIMRDRPDASEAEAFEIHKKETTEYMDFTNSDVKVFIASLDGERCGYIWIAPRNSKDGWDLEKPQWIYDIVVDPKYQGNGIGRRLMERAEEYARAIDQNLGLFVHADNTSAIALYRKTGYCVKVVPISKKLSESEEREAKDILGISRISRLDDAIRTLELQKFKEKVLFSVDVDDDTIAEQYDKFLENCVKPDGKQTRILAASSTGKIFGCMWVGTSGFNDKVAMLYSTVITASEKQKIGSALIESVEAWAHDEGFATVYNLLHSEDDLDMEFFKNMGYKIPGYFMELRVKK